MSEKQTVTVIVDSHLVGPRVAIFTILAEGTDLTAGALYETLKRAADSVRAKAVEETQDLKAWPDAPVYQGRPWAERLAPTPPDDPGDRL